MFLCVAVIVVIISVSKYTLICAPMYQTFCGDGDSSCRVVCSCKCSNFKVPSDDHIGRNVV
jgi:hypothetical protein